MIMVGREKQIRDLEQLYNSEEAQFVAVYGRRRVGKTFLIDETFRNRITFKHAGLSPVEMAEDESDRPTRAQLQSFYYSLLKAGMKKSHIPENWLEAFFMLEMYLEEIDDGSKQLVFLDELPWMDTPKSGFITAFESFWNGWACSRHNFMLVICGSANSWIVDKLINNHGGLYNRLTYEIKLEPFTLAECEEYLESKKVRLSRYDIVQSYMLLGGIPYYLNYFKRGYSLAQNIDELFFSKNGQLNLEYERLFASIFTNPEMMKKIISALAKKTAGMTRKNLVEITGIKDGGTLTKALNALIVSDFIEKYVPFGFKKNEEHYKLIDPFCIFYNHFIHNKKSLPSDFWQREGTSAEINSWRGFAFENVCFNHIPQIKEALGIRGVSSSESAWTKREDEDEGTQIDLLIDRKDNVVNMCEIKFYSDIFTVTKQYDAVLRHRRILLERAILKKSIVHSTLITTYGLKYNEYSGDFDNVITLDDLFA